jgi:hypothetical protein
VLLTLRNQPTVQKFDRIFIAKGIIEHCVIGRATYAFPLYYYDADGKKHMNLNAEIAGNISKRLDSPPTAMDIFDYIYGVLHDPAYREKYHEFLKMDFPHVPYPKNEAEFDRYMHAGERLRKLHLLEHIPAIQTSFPVPGDDVIDNVRFENGKVFINAAQYFENVPAAVWNFYVGGSCPAQKYMKDRRGRILSFEEQQHYQRIVAVLKETDKIMRATDETYVKWCRS